MSLAQVHALVAQHGATPEQPCVEGESQGNAAGVAGYVDGIGNTVYTLWRNMNFCLVFGIILKFDEFFAAYLKSYRGPCKDIRHTYS